MRAKREIGDARDERGIGFHCGGRAGIFLLAIVTLGTMKPLPFALALASSSLLAQEGAALPKADEARAKDPILGKWVWHGGHPVTVAADGTATSTKGPRATWKFLNNKELERKYEVVWDEGIFIDTVRLSRDFKKVEGKNQKGERITAVRAPAP